MSSRSAALATTLALFFALSGSAPAFAKQLEIIHTNDLHSFFEHGDDDSRGGYAAVKATIDRLKARAQARGVETLVLDAGDFSEGTPFYMAGDGTDSMRLMMKMGYDAIAIGNHDWLVGPQQMDWIFGAVQPQVPMLSANFHASSDYANINQYIQPDTEITRGGLRIGIFGLSTNDPLYSWRDTDGNIDDPNDTAQQEVQNLRATNDLVIALTHLGVDADQSLASNVSGIDLIVGGHSHTVLSKPLMIDNPNGVPVPIVQAGAHGNYVGDMLLDYEPGERARVLNYQLVPVFKSQGQDPVIAQQVSNARHDLETRYGSDWLYHVVGVTDTQMIRPMDGPSAWGNFYMDAIREAAGADMALDSSEFFGESQPAGPITREMLMDFYPRFFDLSQPMGWTIWTIDVPGWLLKIVMEISGKEGTFYDLSSCTYDITLNPLPRVTNMRVGGKPLNVAKIYRVAVTEGLGMGARDMHWFLKIFFKPKDTGIPVWQAVEDKIERGGGPVLLKGTEPARLPQGPAWKPAGVDRILNFF